MEDINNNDEGLRELFQRDFIFDSDPESNNLANPDRVRSIRRIKGFTVAGALVVAGVACVGLDSGDSSEALPVLSTTTAPVTTVVEIPATSSTLIVETMLPRVFDCEGGVEVESGDTLSAIARACGTTVEALVTQNAIADPNILYTDQHIITATTQPPVTEAPTTIETTIPVETILAPSVTEVVESVPAETVPLETTVSVILDDGVLSEAACNEYGGLQHEVPAAYGWYKIAKLIYMKVDGSKAVEDTDIARMLKDPEFIALQQRNKVVYLMGTEADGTKHLECFPTQAQKDEAVTTGS